MQKIFSQQIRFKDADGKNFPKWEEKKLGEVAVFLKGKGISKDDVVEHGKNKCIRYGELYTEYSEIIKNVISYTNTPKEKSILSEKNDILMPTSDVTPNGLATVSALCESGVILGGDILVIRSDKILNTFFSYYVHTHKKDIMKLVSGVTVYHIYGSDLKNLKVNLPPLSEQHKMLDLYIRLCF
jgi:restriction endonuclease S subunit